MHEDTNFQPFGIKVDAYSPTDSDDHCFEIYEFFADSKESKLYASHWQTLAQLVIDGASPIDVDDPNWRFFAVFRREKSTHRFESVGFCSLYRFYLFPGPDTWRMRISQFIILPPYQHHGHGSRLYEYIVQEMMKDTSVLEINVEDPNEAFTDMRDKSDLRRMRRIPSIMAIISNRPQMTEEDVRKIQKQLKLNKV